MNGLLSFITRGSFNFSEGLNAASGEGTVYLPDDKGNFHNAVTTGLWTNGDKGITDFLGLGMSLDPAVPG